MAKQKTVYLCQNCEFQTPKWLGQCPECKNWNMFTEQIQGKKSNESQKPVRKLEVCSLTEIGEKKIETRLQTGIEELDRVLGGGLVRSALTLIGGEPGIGKSTLLIETCGKLAQLYPSKSILYVSGEESREQVASRAHRLGIHEANIYIIHETEWESILETLISIKPLFMVLDSIQTTVTSQLNSAAGTVSQVREVTYELMNQAKVNGITCFVIGHITKDGNLSGPKVLEHMVDTVLTFEGDQFNQYRMLRVNKNRYGNSMEIGLFEMEKDGLRQVKNPSQFFINQYFDGAYGRSLTSIMEGSRPLFVEVQALVSENKHGNGRRTTHGIDQNRLAMLVAVIEKYLEIPMSFNDIYLNVVGGLKLNTRDSDLAIIASILSSHYSTGLSDKTIFIGEVGLTGEVRPVSFFDRRVREIGSLGYEQVITAKSNTKKNKQIEVRLVGIEKVSDLKEIFLN